jgi:peptidoglycan/xylan/chitin deacetylase (PgdA/CDA1 family)
MKLITTSWDDGHIADLRLAELLEKYNLPGTFYIPSTNQEHSVMDENKIISLSHKFEIGGHTINHTRINKVSSELFTNEITGCYNWLSNLLGTTPISFCFPGGVYNNDAVKHTLNTGFKVIRTTELLNPWFDSNASVFPTTLQVYEHSKFTYIKHLCKRIKIQTLMLYLKSNTSKDLLKLLEFYLTNLQLNGGCFHLWGHSWEIEENNLWSKLEEIFKIMSDIPDVDYIFNKDFLNYKN